jgi:hypothetical protein
MLRTKYLRLSDKKIFEDFIFQNLFLALLTQIFNGAEPFKQFK